MAQTEWIISIDDDLKDIDELFVGNIRDGEQLIRCKDCKHRFEGEIFSNCCEVLMEMSLWLVEIPVKDDWHCGSGERKEE